MSAAVVRTVVDPETGETLELMGFWNHGKVRYQRKRSFEERATTPAVYDNLARFGEISSSAFGQKRGPDGEFPQWKALRERVPRTPLTLPGKREAAEARQRRYRELLGEQLPEVHDEVLLRRAMRLPSLATGRSRAALIADVEARLEARLQKAKSTLFR
jgi:hypothetical protein